MKVRTTLGLAGLAVLAVTFVSCSKKEKAAETGDSSSGGTRSPQAVEQATAGSIIGTVKLDGVAPKRRKVDMHNDPGCAATHPGGVLEEAVIADAGGGLANAVVYVTNGLGGRAFVPPSSAVTIDQKGCIYSPHVVALMVGQPLRIVNADQTLHNVHFKSQGNGEWNRSQVSGVAAIETKFDHEEVGIPLRCNVHPWMGSYIAVFKHPHFQVTSPDGGFELKGLPPGTYTVRAWHEIYGTVSVTVTIGPKEQEPVILTFRAGAKGG